MYINGRRQPARAAAGQDNRTAAARKATARRTSLQPEAARKGSGRKQAGRRAVRKGAGRSQIHPQPARAADGAGGSPAGAAPGILYRQPCGLFFLLQSLRLLSSADSFRITPKRSC